MRRQAGLLAGFDVLDLEVAAIGDDIDLLDIENDAGGLGSPDTGRPLWRG
jgi:hypothetical protein